MRIVLIPAAILFAAAPGAASQQAEAPAATPTGAPRNCVALTQIRRTEVHGDRIINFVLRDGRVLRNELPLACPGLGFEERFSYRTSTGQLCSVDTIEVLRSPGLSGGPTCGLGMFQPVERAAAE
ncbi:hypothetical protein [Sphingosinithalassobacter sp. LHW66-3]|uniref:hypothetical protein n=1 Tax=Sphingosinithalassobacter sp. LHW66-3 TaxID=3424718 RepID=UPI003D6BB3A1